MGLIYSSQEVMAVQFTDNKNMLSVESYDCQHPEKTWHLKNKSQKWPNRKLFNSRSIWNKVSF